MCILLFCVMSIVVFIVVVRLSCCYELLVELDRLSGYFDVILV